MERSLQCDGSKIIINKMIDLVHKDISFLERGYKAKYLLDSCVKVGKDGNWSNFPVSIFFTEKKHSKGSHYFGLYNFNKELYICNAESAIKQPIPAYVAKNGDIVYSTYRHDFRSSPDGSVTVDGGRDYRRCLFDGSKHKPIYCEILIVKDRLLVWRD